MRTFAAAICSASGGAKAGHTRASPAGFTLLEMVVVLVILSALVGISIPMVQSLLQGQVQRESTRLARVVRVLRNEAVLTQTNYRLMVNLKEQAYWVESRSNGRYRAAAEGALMARHLFPAQFALTDLSVLGSTHTREAEDRPVAVNVDPSGFVDPFLLHFTADGTEYTFKVSGFRTEMDLMKGYIRE